MEKISTANHNPFPDLNGTEYDFKAAQWACTQGMAASGMNFDGDEPYSRNLAVTYLWKEAGEPLPAKEAGFTDIIRALHNMDAVSWAVEAGITSGTSAATFSPDTACTRGQIVTFLYRAMANHTSTGEPGSTSTWNQAFYETLTPEQQALYKNGDDFFRHQMQTNMEIERRQAAEGWHGAGELDDQSNRDAWSQIYVGG